MKTDTAPEVKPVERHEPAVLPLGTVRRGLHRVEVGFHAEDLLGPAYVCGKARSGKTWLLEAIAIHLARTGAGFCFVDPHRDAATELTEYLAGRSDVLLVDLARTDRQAGMNPLEVGSAEEVADVVSRTVGAFQAAYGWSDRSHPRTMTLARMATQALVEANLVLHGDCKATLFQLPALLTDPRFRAAVLTTSSHAVAGYFSNEYPRYEPQAVAPLLDKVSALQADRRTMLLLGQSTTLDVRRAMDAGQVLVVSLAGLGDKGQLVGSLIVYEFFRAAKARADTPPADRLPFFLICDEVQLYQSPVLAAACGETPKYGLKLILANQFLGHLTKEVRGAILGNYSQLFCFGTHWADAQVLAHELGPPVRPDHLVSLQRFTCLARLTVGTRRLPAFQAMTLDVRSRFPKEYRPDEVPAIKERSDAVMAVAEGDDVAADLACRNERIVAVLTGASTDDATTDLKG